MGTTGPQPVRALLLLILLIAAGVGGALYAMQMVEPGESTPDAPPAALVSPDAAPGAAPKSLVRTAPGPASAALASVRGIVRLYRTKAAAAGLTLTLSRPDAPPLTATTGDDGAFRIAGVPSGKG